MRKAIFIGLGMLVAAGVWLKPTPAEAVLLGFDPVSPFSVTSGNPVSVDVVISDLGGSIVSAFDLDVSYDTTFLTATSVTFGTDLGLPLFFQALTFADVTTPGVVDFREVSLLSDAQLATLQSGLTSITLATLQFNAVASGQTSLAFLFGPGQDIKGAGNQVIFPTAIPEPGTWAVFMLGLAAMGLAGWHRRI